MDLAALRPEGAPYRGYSVVVAHDMLVPSIRNLGLTTLPGSVWILGDVGDAGPGRSVRGCNKGRPPSAGPAGSSISRAPCPPALFPPVPTAWKAPSLWGGMFSSQPSWAQPWSPGRLGPSSSRDTTRRWRALALQRTCLFLRRHRACVRGRGPPVSLPYGRGPLGAGRQQSRV